MTGVQTCALPICDRAEVCIDEAFEQVSSVDELVDFIRQEWGIGIYY